MFEDRKEMHRTSKAASSVLKLYAQRMLWLDWQNSDIEINKYFSHIIVELFPIYVLFYKIILNYTNT